MFCSELAAWCQQILLVHPSRGSSRTSNGNRGPWRCSDLLLVGLLTLGLGGVGGSQPLSS